MRSTQLLFFLFVVSFCFASPVAAQMNDFLFDAQAGLTAAVVKEIGSAKASVAAFKTSLYGRASVRILIDEAGNVSSVENVTGPGYICASVDRPDVVAARDTAATAARMVKFEPAKVGDQPMASAGWLYFDMGKPDPAPKDDGEKRYFSASNAPPKVPAKVEGEKYTVIGRPPPDYAGPVQGQTTAPPNRYKNATAGDSKSLSGGVLNGKARHLPVPPYPPAARAVRASGPVTIQVLIDEDGSMFSAEAVSGHPLLRSASRLAACGASFSPTLLEGHPVKVVGLITYNFVSP